MTENKNASESRTYPLRISVINDDRLNLTDVRVFSLILDFNRTLPQTVPSDTWLSKRVGKHRTTVNRAISKLQQLGYVKIFIEGSRRHLEAKFGQDKPKDYLYDVPELVLFDPLMTLSGLRLFYKVRSYSSNKKVCLESNNRLMKNLKTSESSLKRSIKLLEPSYITRDNADGLRSMIMLSNFVEGGGHKCTGGGVINAHIDKTEIIDLDHNMGFEKIEKKRLSFSNLVENSDIKTTMEIYQYHLTRLALLDKSIMRMFTDKKLWAKYTGISEICKKYASYYTKRGIKLTYQRFETWMKGEFDMTFEQRDKIDIPKMTNHRAYSDAKTVMSKKIYDGCCPDVAYSIYFNGFMHDKTVLKLPGMAERPLTREEFFAGSEYLSNVSHDPKPLSRLKVVPHYADA